MQCRVLVVEDNPDDAFALRLHLNEARSARYEVVECETLSEGIDRLASDGFDIVLLDLSLPDCHGPQTVIRTVNAAPSVPIVVLTGLDDERVGIDAVQAGAQDYLVKGSFDTYSLQRVIRYSIERHKLLLQQTATAARWAAMAEENARLVEAVEASDRLKTRFVATMSHELRSTLSAIINLTEILNDSHTERSKARHKEVVRLVRQTAQESLRVLDATIELSRAETSDAAAADRPLVVAELFTQLEKETRVKQRGVKLSWTVEGDVPDLILDAVKLKMILRNLLSNALKFTRDGQVAITARHAGDRVELTVRDSGKGIAAEQIPLLFEPFVQLAGEPRGGGGLGLYVVQRLVQLLGGTIQVESTVGEGSAFTVGLPVRPIPAAV